MLEFLITALAAWRLAHLLVKEDGPLDIFARIRRRAGIDQVIVRNNDTVDVAWVAGNSFAEGLMCVWCVSVWTATFFVLGNLIPFVCVFIYWLARILAISAVAIIIQEIVAIVRGAE